MNNRFRVEKFDEFIGQTKIKQTLKVLINSSFAQKKPIDHILFYGPPGLGKTTLAKIISNETKQNIVFVQGPLLEKKSDLLTLLSSIKENDIIFIDEIHCINHNLEELLYTAMEDGVIDITLGVDGDKRIMRMTLKPFSLIAATTKFDHLSKPLKDRFGFIGKLINYNTKEIAEIISNSAIRNNISIDNKSIEMIALHSNNNPRVANMLLKRVFDFSLYDNQKMIDEELVKKTFGFIGIFDGGLTQIQIQYLETLNNVFTKKYASIDAISSITKDDKQTIINEIEPQLLVKKFIEKSPRGRRITDEGVAYLTNFKIL
ncbi:Holliday junction DNA helicase RuvB [Metamycoplasma cloacale]|uniref:Holliday junction branch migration complex subunit RuvB n=1 Tax=Metamycoplasma cloacale TaxID=92401 RepID=A0A2Z4LME2_9BACT|nr:Holliday junction branch migration DNA helicase RuvB [Metamycoplasma cloacale]AWX42824.1 Holliday junction branch migration DNA helicase RuvB [Metamycoplasma cloacale]VEU79357.1 Holliday junction DNA helicase RuvB [Metamycoplasma cloacale]